MSNKTKPAAPAADTPAPAAEIVEAGFELVDNTDAPAIVEAAPDADEFELTAGVTQVNYI